MLIDVDQQTQSRSGAAVQKNEVGMARQRFTQEQVDALNGVAPLDALNALSLSWQRDHSFKPRQATGTVRLHVEVQGRRHELLVNAAKWYDTGFDVGGHGAVSMLMHLFACSFVSAGLKLRKFVLVGAGATVPHGPVRGDAPVTQPVLFRRRMQSQASLMRARGTGPISGPAESIQEQLKLEDDRPMESASVP